MAEKVKVGIVGCGNISGCYFEGCKKYDLLEVVACSDLLADRARARAEEFGVPRACSTKELLADPEVDIVVNLTIPNAHSEVNMAAVEAGKNVYVEKPLAVTREEGRRTVEAARRKGVLLGGAPDTFMGGGAQTCRKILDEGTIGEPVAATAFWVSPGHEGWHPAPEFYYKKGGGPILDMGPYYVTALVNLLGPVARVTGSTRMTHPTRVIGSEPLRGKVMEVEVTTHVAGVMDFASGAVGTIITSFDVWSSNLPIIEIYGTEGTMCVPDPNRFLGPVRIRLKDDTEWREVPLTHNDEVRRGIGVADMAYALTYGRPHRASGELTYHVLDVMSAFDEASSGGKHVKIESTCSRPAPLPPGLALDELDT